MRSMKAHELHISLPHFCEQNCEGYEYSPVVRILYTPLYWKSPHKLRIESQCFKDNHIEVSMTEAQVKTLINMLQEHLDEIKRLRDGRLSE